jgi:Cu/Ag efflux protein CusF
MKAHIQLALIAITFVVSAPVMAQMDHSTMHGAPPAKAAASSADSAMAEGLVKKMDKSKGAVTLAHGAMNGMPPMTMVYRVKDASLLDKLQVGKKIRFATDPADGGMTVTRIEQLK